MPREQKGPERREALPDQFKVLLSCQAWHEIKTASIQANQSGQKSRSAETICLSSRRVAPESAAFCGEEQTRSVASFQRSAKGISPPDTYVRKGELGSWTSIKTEKVKNHSIPSRTASKKSKSRFIMNSIG